MTTKRRANAAYVRKDPARWKHAGWTSQPNSIIRDPDIPPDECWAWAWLASHDEDFEVSGKKLYEAKASLGRNRAYELLSELERRGLLLRYHAYDPDLGVPYVQYELQPTPAPEEERTWQPPRAQPRRRAPHPGSKAARLTPVDKPVSAGQDAFPTGRESAGRRRVPDRAGIRSDQGIPDRAGMRGSSRQAGSRQGGNPYKEEKNIQEENQPTNHGGRPAASRVQARDGWMDGSPARGQSLGEQWLRGLPPELVPNEAAIVDLADHVTTLLSGGWTTASLARRVTDGVSGAANPPGLVVYRLRAIQAAPRSDHEAPVDDDGPCGKCDARPGEPMSARLRWVSATEWEWCSCHPRGGPAGAGRTRTA